jgi:hypothetical protein
MLDVPVQGGTRQSPPQRNRPNMGPRNPSIGIRRTASSQELRDQAVLNTTAGASTLALQPTRSRLPALDETCQLDLAQAPSKTSSTSSNPKEQPGRLRRASNAFQTKLGFKKDKANENEKDLEAGAPPVGQVQIPREYAANMVDVLDTLGKSDLSYTTELFANNCRSRSPNSHISNERAKLAFHPQSRKIRQPSTYIQLATGSK